MEEYGGNNKYGLVEIRRDDEVLEPGIDDFGLETAEAVNRYHRSFPMYAPVPLYRLDGLAKVIRLAGVYIKDESQCFGLNSFKALGSSYAAAGYVAERVGVGVDQIDYDLMVSPEMKAELGDITFATATDGNHGRAVAWMAREMGQKCVVYMPRGTAKERLNNIKSLGADAQIMDMDYDECVRHCKMQAVKNGWMVIQDTAWPGYEKIPKWIMQGYTSMAFEAVQQSNGAEVTHVFLQAGVGSMAGAVAAFYASLYHGAGRPKIVVVEPEASDCLFQSADAGDGQPHNAAGNMQTMMAGLCCGEPNPIGWNILREHADFFVRVPEECASEGMKILARPFGKDAKIISGESGAVTTGLLVKLMMDGELAGLRERIGLDRNSRVMLFSTEGATDKMNYMNVLSAK